MKSIASGPLSLWNLVRKSTQNVEKIARFPGREQGRRIPSLSSCHGFLQCRVYGGFQTVVRGFVQRSKSLAPLKWSLIRTAVFTLSGPVLRDTARLSQRYPPIARYGVFGFSTWPIGCDTPSPFSEHFPLGEHAKWRCDTPPHKRGISAILARYHMKTRHKGCDAPLCDTISKG